MRKRPQTSVEAQVQGILKGYDPKQPETLANVKVGVQAALKLYFLRMNRKQEEFVRL